MRIVFVTPHLPAPPNFGGARRMYELIRYAAARHEVTTLSLMGPDDDLATAERAAIGRLVPVPVPVTSRSAPGPARRRAQLRSLASPRSFQHGFFHHPHLQRELDRLIAAGTDLVQFEFSQMGSYRVPGNLPTVLDLHNIEHRLLAQHALSGGLARRAFNRLDERKFRGEEWDAWRRASLCLATSAEDALEVERVTGRPAPIIPNGVDTSFFQRRPLTGTSPCDLIFVGALRYRPNADAVRTFVETTLPLLRARLPEVTLTVVGADPPRDLMALDGLPGVRVVGSVPDVRPWLAAAGAVVVPLAVGGGTRLKILEAFAMGRPVISTPLGAAGLEVRDREHLLLASRPEEFVASVERLLNDSSLGPRLTDAAHQLVRERYEWARIAARLDDIYRTLVNARRVPGGSRP